MVGEALSVMKGRKSHLHGRELSPIWAATKGEWCVERTVTTSCDEVCAVGAGEGLRAVAFERVKEAMDGDEELSGTS